MFTSQCCLEKCSLSGSCSVDLQLHETRPHVYTSDLASQRCRDQWLLKDQVGGMVHLNGSKQAGEIC